MVGYSLEAGGREGSWWIEFSILTAWWMKLCDRLAGQAQRLWYLFFESRMLMRECEWHHWVKHVPDRKIKPNMSATASLKEYSHMWTVHSHLTWAAHLRLDHRGQMFITSLKEENVVSDLVLMLISGLSTSLVSAEMCQQANHTQYHDTFSVTAFHHEDYLSRDWCSCSTVSE